MATRPPDHGPPGSKDPKEVGKMLQQLHDQGVIDLDAPLKNVIPQLEKQLQAVRNARPKQQAPYVLVGDRSWFKHLS